MNVEHDMREMRDRLRRIETRLTSYMESQGHDTGAVKPFYSPHEYAVIIPGMNASLKDILDCLPVGIDRCDIRCKGVIIGTYVRQDYTVAK